MLLAQQAESDRIAHKQRQKEAELNVRAAWIKCQQAARLEEQKKEELDREQQAYRAHNQVMKNTIMRMARNQEKPLPIARCM